MKILQILPALGQGGVERGTVEIASALTVAGIPNAVISAGGPLVHELESMGVTHYELPVHTKNPFLVYANAADIARIASEGHFTLMHVRSRAPAWSVRRASRISGIPWISTFHGVYGVEPKWLKLPYNRVMLDGACTICVSDFVRQHVIDTYGADPARLVRIHRGADVTFFNPEAVSEESAMRKKVSQYGIPRDIPVITIPGRLTRWKGQEVLLEAVGKMRHRRVTVIILGSDQGRTEYSDHLRDMANRLSDETKVVFRDHTREMQKVYALSDVVVSASSSQPEAFGRVIPEAQAMGRLVVGTAHGGACETIDDGRTGFLVPPGDVDALAAKLDEVLDLAPERRAEICAAAVKSVQENFSTAKMCEATLRLYRELHGEKA